MLDRQPEVNFPVGKEIHFWDLNFSFDNDWYESKFETVWYMRAFTNSKNFKQGDFTPAYVILEPSVINKIYNFFPDLELIYLMRNAIERAWSSALIALWQAEMKFDEASDAWFIDHFNFEGSLFRDDYEKCIKNRTSI